MCRARHGSFDGVFVNLTKGDDFVLKVGVVALETFESEMLRAVACEEFYYPYLVHDCSVFLIMSAIT